MTIADLITNLKRAERYSTVLQFVKSDYYAARVGGSRKSFGRWTSQNAIRAIAPELFSSSRGRSHQERTNLVQSVSEKLVENLKSVLG